MYIMLELHCIVFLTCFRNAFPYYLYYWIMWIYKIQFRLFSIVDAKLTLAFIRDYMMHFLARRPLKGKNITDV